jgi:co-chaperonin GroES (HSP10)
MSLEDLQQAFPEVDPGVKPLGSRILIQIRSPETRSKGGIILTDSDKDTQYWNTTVAKVVAVGPLAFKNRNTQESWPEGDWCKPGDFVRAPRYGGDRWKHTDASGKTGYFCLINDLDVLAAITTDPLQIRAFI